jgi:hypothetical protein
MQYQGKDFSLIVLSVCSLIAAQISAADPVPPAPTSTPSNIQCTAVLGDVGEIEFANLARSPEIHSYEALRIFASLPDAQACKKTGSTEKVCIAAVQECHTRWQDFRQVALSWEQAIPVFNQFLAMKWNIDTTVRALAALERMESKVRSFLETLKGDRALLSDPRFSHVAALMNSYLSFEQKVFADTQKKLHYMSSLVLPIHRRAQRAGVREAAYDTLERAREAYFDFIRTNGFSLSPDDPEVVNAYMGMIRDLAQTLWNEDVLALAEQMIQAIHLVKEDWPRHLVLTVSGAELLIKTVGDRTAPVRVKQEQLQDQLTKALNLPPRQK